MVIVRRGMGVSPNIPRTFAFIDGENLVFRYQALLANGRTPRPQVRHERDVYVWCPDHLFLQGHFDMIRAYYFASAVGDAVHIGRLETALDELRFSSSSSSPIETLLYARLFKKPAHSQKSKNVDLGIALELMTHSYRNDLDAAILFSGDGDLAPVVEKITQAGKRVIVWGFTNGFSDALRRAADRTFYLDEVFFEPDPSPAA